MKKITFYPSWYYRLRASRYRYLFMVVGKRYSGRLVRARLDWVTLGDL